MSDKPQEENRPNAPIPPLVLVIFGITGDLAKRKVLPALYHLLKDDLLPADFELIGTSRREISTEYLLKEVELCVLAEDNICDPVIIGRFRDKLRMLKLDPLNGDDYDNLRNNLDEVEAGYGKVMNRLFYLSIPPQVYGPIVKRLGEHGLNRGSKQFDGESRLLVEKPFGYDLTSAEELIEATGQQFSEQQIYRIDHYLAKESAQNILTFREENPLFRSVWDNKHIKNITVTAAEKIGIEGRADFYEQVGALRDLIQSHLLQLLALTTMELPGDVIDANAIHASKQALLNAVKPPPADQMGGKVIRGQYEGYKAEVNNADSTTETYASIQLSIDTPRWEGVPITLTTGKSLADKRTEITVCIGEDSDESPNKLTFRVQPNEGIDVELLVKQPGFEQALQTAQMEFSYQATFDEHDHPDAYERVLIDAARGDHALFATSEEVLASWRILQPILNHWAHSSDDLMTYAVGSNGPSPSDA
jgi:glucose-6-phosphate 1-dehydrogenase